ncbi:MAG: hypothetical protein KGL39_52575 [Patescibacteria group bacterium]|nr:hypothetical protein [Patescibacteria group bacterium]
MPNLQRLCKWRAHFAGWQLGTRLKGDPECDAVRDHREATLALRAEVSALSKLLIDKGVFTAGEFMESIEEEARLLEQDLQVRFPGVKATDEGLVYDERAVEWMKDWLA